jgi:FkbM family methyltransferase
MKKFLIKVRSVLWINFLLRNCFKIVTTIGQKTASFCSIHWPVYGKIQFKLPFGEVVKIYSEGDDFVSTQAYWKGYTGYEGPSVQLFYYISKKTKMIFDVGANVGYFTLIAGNANREAHIHSFEPVEHIFKRLTTNIHLNNLKNVSCVKSVVGDSELPITFYLPIVTGMAHAGSTKKGWASNVEEIKVPSTTIDKYKEVNKISKIDLIKLDCEFHEVEILKGMTETLNKDKPIILMEILFPFEKGMKGWFENDSYLEIENIMKKHNYFSYLINETALVRVDNLEYNPDDRNYLFSTKKLPKRYNHYSEMDSLVNELIF